MKFNEPRVEFVSIDMNELVTSSDNSNCGGSNTEPGGGEACANAYYRSSQCGYEYNPKCPDFC